MPEERVTFAPRVLIYVPGIGRDPMNSAATIARSIARTADRDIYGEVAANEKTPPAPPGLKAVCTIVAADAGDGAEGRLLDVVEYDYRERLKAIGARDGKEAAPRGPLQAVVTAIVATAMLVQALWRPYKSPRAKFQLVVGLAVSLVLIGWSAYLVAAAIVTLVSSATGTEIGGWWGAVFAPDSTWVLFGGLITAGSYIAFRDGIIRTSNRIAQIIDYHTRSDCAKDLADSLGSAVDAIRDQHPGREVHVLAYSFGSVLLLDTVVPFDGDIPTRPGSFVNSIDSMTTVGCPADFAALYLPHYFTGRTALRSSKPSKPVADPITWNNVFIASDLFGSNFAKRAAASDEEVRGSGIDEKSGEFEGPCGMPVQSFRYLPQERLTLMGWLKQSALRQHARYWGTNGGCWNFVLDHWIPRVGDAPPAGRQPTPEQPTLDDQSAPDDQSPRDDHPTPEEQPSMPPVPEKQPTPVVQSTSELQPASELSGPCRPDPNVPPALVPVGVGDVPRPPEPGQNGGRSASHRDPGQP